ncbi:MAG: ferredoxin reductase family protein [Chloroflexaceae bacterium]
MITLSRVPYRQSLDILRRHTPATLVIYALCAYIALVSLYNLWLGIDVRIGGNVLTLPGDTADPIYELGTSLGFWGFLLFGLNFVLATRWRWVERLFGGLDRVYTLHGLLGRWTLALILLHLGILTAQALPDWGLAATYVVPGLDLSYSLGGAGVLLLTLLVAVTIWVRFPYQRWLAAHRWMGVPYILGGAHAIVAQGDWYLWLLTIAGGYAWIYSSFLYRCWGPRHSGTIRQVIGLHGVTELTIVLDKPHLFQPGQFVFLSVTRAAAGLPDELHPFSISAILDERTFRISAKRLGDYTARLVELIPGDEVVVFGSYGAFGARGLASAGAALWVAGGIGITPFLSMLRHIAEGKAAYAGNIRFIWSVREQADAIYLDEILALSASVPQVRFQLHVTSTDGLLTAERLTALAGDDLTTYRILLCGPPSMMHALTTQLVGRGVRRSRIISEDFALR